VVRKITHILLVLSFLSGGIVSVAPMAFCQMSEAKQDVADCCAVPEAKTEHCSPDSETTCPVCTQNICNSDASPQIKVSSETNFSSVSLLAVVLPTDALTTSLRAASFTAADNLLAQTGPPLYITNQIFRL
jgi:hypothetical protein